MSVKQPVIYLILIVLDSALALSQATSQLREEGSF